MVSGSTGLVGSALVPKLTAAGHSVVRLVRLPSVAGAAAVAWDPAGGRLDAAPLEGFDAVVHLAGENLAAGRWSAARKERIRASRVDGTRLLSETLARLSRRPRTLVAASAIGYYGDRGEEILSEESAPGDDFLSGLCREWEAAAGPAARAGIRVVNLRFGVILSPAGGALAKMLPPFRLGAGGPLGSGRQYVSWIALDDAVAIIHHALAAAVLRGPVNAVAPRPVTNLDLTKTIGRVLSRPTFMPMPAFAARILFGEMADALLLSSARVEPKRLLASGYRFRHPDLEGALRHLLGKAHRSSGD
ncbi:MAG TPA: TIGR01777 family oxidoreductase [Candidatus Polarisedimenticolia bacterium]|nr:TIGR01777 family oxidoreductase [Candidatus Polarisedimenticolia bacterium]